jgi:hypothetical protein
MEGNADALTLNESKDQEKKSGGFVDIIEGSNLYHEDKV